jgi:predicted glutamine amidotransferase
MCRLFGYVAANPTTIEATIGMPALDQFTRLSRLHGDGWGTAWLNPADARSDDQFAYRSPIPAHSDGTFVRHTTSEPSRARIMHLRWATPGLPVRSDNTHPFTVDGMSFAHNGSLMPPSAIETLLEPRFLGSLAGTTDSERYFALIRQELASGAGSTVDAVERAVLALRALFPVASLNALLLTNAELVIVHANTSQEAPPLEDRFSEAAPPLDHVDAYAYYLMRWRRTPDGALVFTSSGLPDDGWIPLAEHSITRVDLGDVSAITDRIPFDEVRAATQ